MSLPRFHVPEAAPGARLRLPDHTAHHAREVLRLRPGARVHVFDGRGHEYDALLEAVTRSAVVAHLHGSVTSRAESPLHIVLAIAPLKGDRMELVIQKATELGVGEIWPVITARTDAVARPARHGSRHERWDRVASGAAEQCGRATVPEIAAAATLERLLAPGLPAGIRVWLDTSSDASSFASLSPPPGPVLLLVGPAGGFEPHESERLLAAGFVAASLGPRVLRSETAAVAAVTAAQLLWGDLGAARR